MASPTPETHQPASQPGTELSHTGAEAFAEIAVDRLQRAAQAGDVNLMNACADVLDRALATLPCNHVLSGKYTAFLAVAYRGRYESTGLLDDLEAGIEWGQRAVTAISTDHSGYVASLYLLAEDYLRRYHLTELLADLHASIDAGERARQLADADHPKHLRRAILELLGKGYHLSALQNGNYANGLELSIDRCEEALALSSTNDPDGKGLLVGLGTAYLTLYERDCRQATLRKGFNRIQQALTLTPTDDPDRHGLIQALAAAKAELSG